MEAHQTLEFSQELICAEEQQFVSLCCLHGINTWYIWSLGALLPLLMVLDSECLSVVGPADGVRQPSGEMAAQRRLVEPSNSKPLLCFGSQSDGHVTNVTREKSIPAEFTV